MNYTLYVIRCLNQLDCENYDPKLIAPVGEDHIDLDFTFNIRLCFNSKSNMSNARRVTLKDIARKAGVSTMAVSMALKDHPRISREMRSRIQEMAVSMGYQKDPMLSSLAYYRTSIRPPAYQSTIAFLNAWPLKKGMKAVHVFKELYQGVVEESLANGYQVEEFSINSPHYSEQKLQQIFFNRNITGLILAPRPLEYKELQLDWSRFSTVALGHSWINPKFHFAANYQYHSIITAIRKIKELGYKRIGFVIEPSQNERADRNWTAGYLTECGSHAMTNTIPFLERESCPFSEFSMWFKRYKPEVILGFRSILIEWTHKLGKSVPNHVGYVDLNCRPDDPLSGILQNSRLVGHAAVQLLVGMLQRNEKGIPSTPKAILIEGAWKEGTTLLTANPK